MCIKDNNPVKTFGQGIGLRPVEAFLVTDWSKTRLLFTSAAADVNGGLRPDRCGRHNHRDLHLSDLIIL